ncbi:MAG: 5-formyltetrahydrofolate cyclo-ligase [Magnetococcales bacterium]|nr:5-formyltetrahydrofolate cyclo-ligase [Magnetococcales bacterium]
MAQTDHTKAALRQRLRSERRALTREQVAERSDEIVRHVVTAPFFERARLIGLYLPFDNEVDPSSLFHQAARAGKETFVPIVEKSTRSMRFVAYRPGDPLQNGAYGIAEPVIDPHRTVARDMLELELVFQPLIGFDRKGCRLGFGGGYHDRALAASRSSATVTCVGLAYAFQEVPSLPREPHDVPMGWVVTERGVRCCGDVG